MFLKTLVISVLFVTVKSDVLETERSSFLGFSHVITISASTSELAEQLTAAVFETGSGERRVRRYFERYDTPFVGENRRMMIE